MKWIPITSLNLQFTNGNEIKDSAYDSATSLFVAVTIICPVIGFVHLISEHVCPMYL